MGLLWLADIVGDPELIVGVDTEDDGVTMSDDSDCMLFEKLPLLILLDVDTGGFVKCVPENDTVLLDVTSPTGLITTAMGLLRSSSSPSLKSSVIPLTESSSSSSSFFGMGTSVSWIFSSWALASSVVESLFL